MIKPEEWFIVAAMSYSWMYLCLLVLMTFAYGLLALNQ